LKNSGLKLQFSRSSQKILKKFKKLGLMHPIFKMCPSFFQKLKSFGLMPPIFKMCPRNFDKIKNMRLMPQFSKCDQIFCKKNNKIGADASIFKKHNHF
jgi:hypothetical protein